MKKNYTVATQIVRFPYPFRVGVMGALKEAGLNGVELLKAMNSSLSDLQDTIDIKPFLSVIEAGFDGYIQGELLIGDESFLGVRDDLVFRKKLDHRYKVTAYDDVENEMSCCVINLTRDFNRFYMDYNPMTDVLSYPGSYSFTTMELGTDSAAFLVEVEKIGDVVRTLSDGYFGAVHQINKIDEILIHLYVCHDAISTESLKQKVEAVLKSENPTLN